MEQFQLQSELNITVIRFLLKRCIHRSFLLLFFVIFAIGKDTSASFVRAAGSQLSAITIYECLVFGNLFCRFCFNTSYNGNSNNSRDYSVLKLLKPIVIVILVMSYVLTWQINEWCLCKDKAKWEFRRNSFPTWNGIRDKALRNVGNLIITMMMKRWRRS